MKKTILILFTFMPLILFAQVLTGRVVKIADGDTFKGLLSGASGVLNVFTDLVSKLQEMDMLIPAILGATSLFKNLNSSKSGNGTTISRGASKFKQQIADIKNMSISDNLLSLVILSFSQKIVVESNKSLCIIICPLA